MTAPTVIVTRPERSGRAWVQALQTAGFQACALPLLDIVPEPMTPALQAAQQRLHAWQAAMFVSGNAVRCFFRAERWRPEFSTVRAWSPGPGTTAALIAAGWPAAGIDGPAATATQLDSEHLWARVAPQVRVGTRILIVRGGDATGRVAGRSWLARQVRQAGGRLEQLVCYRRLVPRWSPQQTARARAAAVDGSIWLFSSSQAIAHLSAALPQQNWAAATALVTHPRIGQAARAAGFGCVRETQPVLADVEASLRSLTFA